MLGNRHWFHQFLCWSGGESLYPEGGHSALGWNDLGGHSTLGQNDRGSFYSGGHSTLRHRRSKENTSDPGAGAVATANKNGNAFMFGI